MTTSAPAEVQKKKSADQSKGWIKEINDMLEQAVMARRISPEILGKFEELGKKAREERDMRQITPTPTSRNSQVARVVPTKEMEMNRAAVVAALKLGETLELTESPRTLSIRAWVEAGRVV